MPAGEKYLKSEVRENEEKFQLAFDNATDAIFWSDVKTGTITNCNESC